MSADFSIVFDHLVSRTQSYGIDVLLERMDIETPGKFDGPTITINPAHGLEPRCYYLAHSFGSIVRWSVAFEEARHCFAELRAAKAARPRDAARLTRALERFAAFEDAASEHAVWLLADLGYPDLIAPYTEFFRADLDAMRIFHRDGAAPRWPEFFARWKATLARSGGKPVPYAQTPVPPFTPVHIEPQEVLQERDGQP
jgi:hypothetical protein